MMTALNPMKVDVIRMGNGLQGVAFVARLSAAFLAMPLPQTFRRRFGQSITRRRLATVATVIGHLDFQSLYPRRQLADRLMKQSHHGFFARIVGRADFFIAG